MRQVNDVAHTPNRAHQRIAASLILWHHPQSVTWPRTLSENVAAALPPGGSADPSPANQQAIGDVNLQALTSIFFTGANQFNAAAYLIFIALGIAWMAIVLRVALTLESHLFML